MSNQAIALDPASVLEADLSEVRRLLAHCTERLTDPDTNLTYRLAMLDRATRLMRLDVSLAAALTRRDEGLLRASGYRAPQEKPARRAERRERPVHYDYGQWLKDHPEEVARDEAAWEAKVLAREQRQAAEENSKTTEPVGPRISVP